MAVSGSGTISDPYIPVTFGDFLSVCGIDGAYVCLQNDIDVSKDNVYKTGLTSPLNIRANIYGTAMTYNSSTTYNTGDKCTWNDGEHGLCTYTCKSDGVVGVDVSDTTYWNRGGDPTKKITGLIITAGNFISYFHYQYLTMQNIFFESCAFFGTGNNYSFINPASTNHYLTFNDCKFSIFYMQSVGANYCPKITYYTQTFNRCSLYFRFNGPDLSSVSYSDYWRVFSSTTTLNNCTIDIENISILAASSGDSAPQFGNMVSSSFRLTTNIYSGTTVRNHVGFNGTNCFFALTALNIETGETYTFHPKSLAGVNIIDSDVRGNASIGGNANLVAGTTAQCKDKDWLISQGFFAS